MTMVGNPSIHFPWLEKRDPSKNICVYIYVLPGSGKQREPPKNKKVKRGTNSGEVSFGCLKGLQAFGYLQMGNRNQIDGPAPVPVAMGNQGKPSCNAKPKGESCLVIRCD